MKKNSAVFTGMGAITPLGDDIEDFYAALPQLKSLAKNAEGPHRRAGDTTNATDAWGVCRIPEELFTGIRGSKFYDKCTKLLYGAVKQLLRDDTLNEDKLCETAIAVGTAFSSLTDFLEFLLSFERGGFRAVNPILFPNTVHNCPASQLAILLKAAGTNITITNGLCSGLDALAAGLEFIRTGRAACVIVGGVEESSFYLREGFRHCLRSCAKAELYPAEAAGMVLLEEEEKARERNAPVYGKIAGYAQSFFPGKIEDEESLSGLIEGTIHQAVKDAEIAFDDVGVISLSLNGLPPLDKAELSAVGRLLRGSRRGKGLVSLKSLIGETAGASGILQLIVALRGMNAPLQRHHRDCLPEAFVQEHDRKLADDAAGQFALIHNLNWEGNFTAVVVERASCGVR